MLACERLLERHLIGIAHEERVRQGGIGLAQLVESLYCEGLQLLARRGCEGVVVSRNSHRVGLALQVGYLIRNVISVEPSSVSAALRQRPCEVQLVVSRLPHAQVGHGGRFVLAYVGSHLRVEALSGITLHHNGVDMLARGIAVMHIRESLTGVAVGESLQRVAPAHDRGAQLSAERVARDGCGGQGEAHGSRLASVGIGHGAQLSHRVGSVYRGELLDGDIVDGEVVAQQMRAERMESHALQSVGSGAEGERAIAR